MGKFLGKLKVDENYQKPFRMVLRGRYPLGFIGLGFLVVYPPAEPRPGKTTMDKKYDVTIWMPLYCDKFLSETENMTPAETRAYIRIQVRLWKEGGYLPNNPRYLQKVSGLSPYNFSKVWQKIEKYFEKDSQKIFKNLMPEEIEKWKKNKISASEKGKKGADARWHKDAPANSPGNSPPGNGSGKGLPPVEAFFPKDFKSQGG